MAGCVYVIDFRLVRGRVFLMLAGHAQILRNRHQNSFRTVESVRTYIRRHDREPYDHFGAEELQSCRRKTLTKEATSFGKSEGTESFREALVLSPSKAISGQWLP